MHACNGLGSGGRPSGHLHQQRIVGAANEGAGVRCAGVEPDAEAGGAAVRRDAAVVRNELVFRVFGGDAALHGVAAQANVRLLRYTAFGRANARAFRDMNLRLHDVDARHGFRDGVFHLDTRVHLDEVHLAGVGVLQELHRTGVAVLRGAANLQGLGAQRLALGLRHEHCRRTFHHLLVATLHGAVALPQVHEVAVAVAQQLHFHMARATNELFEVHLVVAEGCLGLAARRSHLLQQLVRGFHYAHAAATAAPASLQHHRVAHFFGGGEALGIHARQRRRSRHDRDARGHGKVARRNLVTQRAHGGRRGPNELDAGFSAGLGKLGVLGEEAVARMDRVCLRFDRDADDVRNIEISLDGALALAHQVSLVRLRAVEREPVFLRVDGYRANAQLRRGAHDADGDLATVGDEQAVDLAHGELRRAGNASSGKTKRQRPKNTSSLTVLRCSAKSISCPPDIAKTALAWCPRFRGLFHAPHP